jgi:hypothetical protein
MELTSFALSLAFSFDSIEKDQCGNAGAGEAGKSTQGEHGKAEGRSEEEGPRSASTGVGGSACLNRDQALPGARYTCEERNSCLGAAEDVACDGSFEVSLPCFRGHYTASLANASLSASQSAVMARIPPVEPLRECRHVLQVAPAFVVGCVVCPLQRHGEAELIHAWLPTRGCSLELLGVESLRKLNEAFCLRLKDRARSNPAHQLSRAPLSLFHIARHS